MSYPGNKRKRARAGLSPCLPTYLPTYLLPRLYLPNQVPMGQTRTHTYPNNLSRTYRSASQLRADSF